MKINEIVLLEDWVYEGLWDNIKAGYNTYQAGMAGAKAGYASGGQQRAGTAKQQEVAKVFIERWNQAIAQNPAVNTPQLLQQFMTNSTKQSGIKVPAAPATLNPANTAKYITDVIGQSLAAATIGAGAAQEQPAEEPKGPALSPGVAITSEEPMVLNYKGQDYAVNDEGQWSKATNQKAVLSQAMQAFLDKNEKAILDYKPAAQTQAKPQAQPAAPASPAPAEPASSTPAATAEPAPAEPASSTPTSSTPTSSTPTSSTPAAPSLPGAPVNSTVPIKNNDGIKVDFTKSAEGWKGNVPGAKLHKPGTTHYDSLEAEWARLNKQPAPAPTATSAPAAEPSADQAAMDRLNNITNPPAATTASATPTAAPKTKEEVQNYIEELGDDPEAMEALLAAIEGMEPAA